MAYFAILFRFRVNLRNIATMPPKPQAENRRFSSETSSTTETTSLSDTGDEEGDFCLFISFVGFAGVVIG